MFIEETTEVLMMFGGWALLAAYIVITLSSCVYLKLRKALYFERLALILLLPLFVYLWWLVLIVVAALAFVVFISWLGFSIYDLVCDKEESEVYKCDYHDFFDEPVNHGMKEKLKSVRDARLTGQTTRR